MFSVIYSFDVKTDSVETFIAAWKKMTVLLYTREGSLGSRLHKVSDNQYIAYAQWPDRETWAKEKTNLPKSANEYQRIMSECCNSIKTEYAMELVEDLLK
jgi:heme-degrading monooxygenase HmoA